MNKQELERFLNERAHGVTCAVCGRQDWMMNVNEENENILIMCSHCGHVVSFNRSYVKSLLGETEVEDLGGDSSDNDGGNASDESEHSQTDLPVEPSVKAVKPVIKAAEPFVDPLVETVEPVVDLPVETVEPPHEVSRVAVDSGIESGTQVRERPVDSGLGIVDRLSKAVFDLIAVVKTKLYPL